MFVNTIPTHHTFLYRQQLIALTLFEVLETGCVLLHWWGLSIPSVESDFHTPGVLSIMPALHILFLHWGVTAMALAVCMSINEIYCIATCPSKNLVPLKQHCHNFGLCSVQDELLSHIACVGSNLYMEHESLECTLLTYNRYLVGSRSFNSGSICTIWLWMMARRICKLLMSTWTCLSLLASLLTWPSRLKEILQELSINCMPYDYAAIQHTPVAL